MNKTQLVNQVQQNVEGMTKKQAGEAVNAVLEAMGGALSEGNNVTLKGFGTFSVRQRDARDGRHPKTGATIKIPARKVVHFAPSSVLKDSVN